MDMQLQQVYQEYEAGKREGRTSEWLEDILKRYQGRTFLYGAGNAGGEFLKCLRNAGFYPIMFADSNEAKYKTVAGGLLITSVKEIKERFGEDVLFIVTVYDIDKLYKEIKGNLHSLGFINVMHFAEFRNYSPLFTAQNNLHFIGLDIDEIIKNKESIAKAYEALEDEESRKVFLSVLRFRLLSEWQPIPVLQASKQYFDYDIYKKTSNEYFIDCGAFDGDTMEAFIASTEKSFEKYCAFEPDQANAHKINEKILNIYPDLKEKLKVYPNAVLDKKCTVYFDEQGTSNSHISDKNDNAIEAVDLDSTLLGEHPTFIKMDVEGSEIKALKGTEKIIKDNKPVLGICTYHRTEDLWEIPLYIKALNPEYKLYLRSYYGFIENVCYAVPSNREV